MNKHAARLDSCWLFKQIRKETESWMGKRMEVHSNGGRKCLQPAGTVLGHIQKQLAKKIISTVFKELLFLFKQKDLCFQQTYISFFPITIVILACRIHELAR